MYCFYNQKHYLREDIDYHFSHSKDSKNYSASWFSLMLKIKSISFARGYQIIISM